MIWLCIYYILICAFSGETTNVCDLPPTICHRHTESPLKIQLVYKFAQQFEKLRTTFKNSCPPALSSQCSNFTLELLNDLKCTDYLLLRSYLMQVLDIKKTSGLFHCGYCDSIIWKRGGNIKVVGLSPRYQISSRITTNFPVNISPAIAIKAIWL